MTTAELGLAAFDTGVKSIELLIFIIRTAQEVKRLKAECDEVRQTALILKNVLEANKDALKDQATAAKLEQILTELTKFVVDCKESNVLHRAWEVIWKHRLPGLLKDMMMWIALFSAETTASARSDLWKLVNKVDQYQGQQDNQMASFLGKLGILDELKKIQDERRSHLQVDFLDDDSRLSVTDVGGNILAGSLKLGDATVKVICEPVKEELMRYGEKGPRHALIYGQISANTLVHPFYGIAKRFGRRFTVTKDLSSCPSLGSAIANGSLPATSLERLGVAYDIAKTVEYLHSVEVLVKRLSDKTVLLSSEHGTVIPYLTDLERARLFKESTSGGEYDVRYEAPEFQKLPHQQHSIYTDIWSLGILIWQCVLGKFPFDISHEVTEGPEAARVRQFVSQGSLAWKAPPSEALLKQVSRIVDRCCNLVPNVRPSAADVAHSLFDILSMAALDINPVPEIDESVKVRVSQLLEKIDKTSVAVEKISGNDLEDLRRLVTQGDPTAAYLLGSTIWYGLADPGEDLDQFILVAGENQSKEIRARSSLPHLEFAMQAGVKAAAEPLMRAYGGLMQLYHAQVLQYRDMQSLLPQSFQRRSDHS